MNQSEPKTARELWSIATHVIPIHLPASMHISAIPIILGMGHELNWM